MSEEVKLSPKEKERRERDNLIIEYKHMHDDNWHRGNGIWLVNSILVTGSLIVAFQLGSNFSSEKLLAYLVAMGLVAVATTIHITASMVTSITYKEMETIRLDLGMTKTTEMYNSKIKGKWWYTVRTNVVYGLFAFLFTVYFFLFLESLGNLSILAMAGMLIVTVFVWSYIERKMRKVG